MSIDQAVLAFAGSVVLTSVALALLVNIWFIALAIFAGLNMIQASMTGFCPIAIVFRKAGMKTGVAFK